VGLGGIVSDPLTLIRDDPLTVEAGGTAIISASNNLAVSDTEYDDAQITYIATTAPSDGILLDDGTQTSTFTQADLDNNLVAFEETAPWSGQESSTDFFFYASDPASNRTLTTEFQINITAPSQSPVSQTAPTGVTVHADLIAALTGIQVVYNGVANEQFTTVVNAGTGILVASSDYGGYATVSGSGSNSASITGTAAQVATVPSPSPLQI
jgi:hypothetical protein